MSLESNPLNKILEIDLDTDRKVQLLIRQIDRSPRRPIGNQPDRHWDFADNIQVLTSALGGLIRCAEARRVYRPGEVLKFVIGALQDMYVDSELCGQLIKVDLEGNEIPPIINMPG